MEIYGILSNLKINGGVYGNSVILNAVKGKTDDIFNVSQQQKLEPNRSRLSVYYKKEVILNPPEGVPTVEKLTIQYIDTGFE